MGSAPFLEIFLFVFGGPSVQRTAFRLRTGVLRSYRQRVAADGQRGFAPVESGGLNVRVVLVTVQVHRGARIIVQCGQQVGKIAPVFEVRQAPRRVCAAWDGIDAGHALNPRNQVDEEIARDALSVIGKTPPAEESLWTERSLGRVAQPRLPVD